MPSADPISIAAEDPVCEDECQHKAAGGNREEGAELGEGTDKSSLKSPVTPAPVNEPNGTPALRWKSYTAKQKESDKFAAEAVAADPKGKLVINLCGIPRSLMKLAPGPSKMKASMVQDVDKSKSEASTSSQGNPLHHDDDEQDGRPHGPMEVIAGSENSPAGCPEALPQHEMLHVVNNQTAISDLARKVCLRIKRVRRSVKASRFQKMDGCNQASSSKMCAVQEEKAPFSRHGDSRKKKFCHRRLQEVRVVERDASISNKSILEEPCTNAVKEHRETRHTEDLHNPRDEAFTQKETLEKSAQRSQHDTSGSTRGTTASVLTRDHSMVQTTQKDGLTLRDASKESATKVHNNDSTFEDVSGDGIPKETKNDEFTSRDFAAKDLTRVRRTVRSVSHDAVALSETSKLDMKEQTVLETLLRDELPGYSSAGGSEPSRSYKIERSVDAEFSQTEDSESGEAESERGDAECSQTDGYEEADTDSSHSHECEEGECECNGLSPSTPSTPGRGTYLTEHVPSVLCDAEGNVWHIGKRAEQARGSEVCKKLSSSDMVQKESLDFAHNSHHVEVQKHVVKKPSALSVAPFSHQIELNWKWPSDADYTINPVVDVSNRSMVAKEKSVFVGCIPDGTENLEQILQNLMEKFLERFDFAPAILSQIQVVKTVKDFAFLELATEKVAHIVLAANQLDVFEWGVKGFHFNIEGCKGTHTSVRPLIEYMPLKPARVIFVGNIPKSRWQNEYLEVFFARVLRGSDGPADLKFVNSVYLLPESCDAYVELASEIMADAIVFKCTKNPQILKDIGEDVFICRDSSSIPLMSKHKGIICPQRALFVGVSAPGQEFKIDCVRKIFEVILPIISRETNQPGYLEYISVQPGKDYAFFQFNSEAIVDAVMDEYIQNTQLFMCNSSPLSYIILRPPGYVRPGARYRSDSNRQGVPGMANTHMNTHFSKQGHHTSLDRKRQPKNNLSKQSGTIPVVPRRFGDEPAKKSDCIMSIGVSQLPMATWNGLFSTGACAADPECMLVIEGLPKGLSYKLLRGALNELFEKFLCHTGLLEVGMLVLRYLDRDGNLDVVASLPSAKFVNALLSMRDTFVVAGNEVRLLPRGRKRKFNWRGNPADYLRGQGELSCLSDDEANQVREPSRYCGVDAWNAPSLPRRKRGRLEMVSHGRSGRGHGIRRKGLEFDTEAWCEQEGLRSLSPPPKVFRGDIKETFRGVKGSWKVASKLKTDNHVPKAMTVSQWQEGSPRGIMPHICKSAGALKFGNRGIVQVRKDRLKPNKDFPKEVLHIVSEGGIRKIQTIGTPFYTGMGVARGIVRVANKKRKQLHAGGQDGLVQKSAFTQKRFKIRPHFPGVM